MGTMRSNLVVFISLCLSILVTKGFGMEKLETATFGGGCFWCIEAVFEQLDGVKSVVAGYAGGTTVNPTYEQVCTDTTGHAEVAQIAFDPSKISYEQLLDVFWRIHDPTTPNRQGPDVGSQYRSAIFFHTPEQEHAARASKAKIEASGRFKRPIVTEIAAASPFYRAEEYHQKYLQAHPGGYTCHFERKLEF